MTYKYFLICSQQIEEDRLRRGNRTYGHRCVRPTLYLYLDFYLMQILTGHGCLDHIRTDLKRRIVLTALFAKIILLETQNMFSLYVRVLKRTVQDGVYQQLLH